MWEFRCFDPECRLFVSPDIEVPCCLNPFANMTELGENENVRAHEQQLEDRKRKCGDGGRAEGSVEFEGEIANPRSGGVEREKVRDGDGSGEESGEGSGEGSGEESGEGEREIGEREIAEREIGEWGGIEDWEMMGLLVP
jgi:hypothetical protein